ncbi:MAG: low molecular weight phosphotyrosine protein phosphatase [Planctomycetota bacterium]|nr:MAG: low molecular weight phosphotyrosine protein phosphatase [Planctomycetota bacterium]
MQPAICFVCLGNICRSPSAEAVFRQLVSQRPDAAQWRIDSCGTGDWHVGKRPDPRALRALARRGYESEHRGRQLCAGDFQNFDWLLVMDDSNLSDVRAVAPSQSRARIAKLSDWDPLQQAQAVADPYYGGEEGFASVLDLIERCCEHFLQQEYPRK